MTNITKLTKSHGSKKGGKLQPPPGRDVAPHNVAIDPKEREAIRTLQFKLPESVFTDFSERAAREFGFSHGAKTKLFYKMFEVYKASLDDLD